MPGAPLAVPEREKRGWLSWSLPVHGGGRQRSPLLCAEWAPRGPDPRCLLGAQEGVQDVLVSLMLCLPLTTWPWLCPQAPECQQDQLHQAGRLPGPAEPLASLPVRQQDPEPRQGHLHLPAGHPDPVSALCPPSAQQVDLGGGNSLLAQATSCLDLCPSHQNHLLGRKERRHWVRQSWVQIPAMPHIGCVTLGKLTCFSGPQFTYS